MKKYDIKTTDVETLKKWYHLMTLGRALDEKAPSYLLQSLGWSYHAPYAGHDGIQLAIGQVFTLGEDFLFPYYRDMLTVLSAGMTAEEIILNGISKATDPGSGGRHMSNHFAKPEWHIENISSATGTHDLHAAGVARAMVYYGHKGVAITSHGESATSEGFVYEAINGASLEQLPVIFVIQDNGYGISVPKSEQTANRKVAENFSGFIGYLVAPSAAIALPRCSMAVKMLRSSVLSQLDADYVRTAYSRGNSTRRVMYHHVLKNALIPVLTFWGMTIADIVANSIILEQVFSIPGMGNLLITSISNRDYPVVQGILVLIAALIIIINFVVDLLYGRIDPRIRVKD